MAETSGPLQALFFQCEQQSATCTSEDARLLLNRCGRYESIGFDEASLTACCYAQENDSVRQCLYFKSSTWTAYRISIVHDSNRGTQKPMLALSGWEKHNNTEWIDIAGVTIPDITPLTFAYGKMQKL